MSEELKPCPFCRGEAEEIHYSEWGGPGNLAWLIRCPRCYAKMTGTHRDMNRAAWNARAERTCEWTRAEQWENAEGNDYIYGYETACGHRHTWWPESLPSYCPSCGREVANAS